MFLQFLFIILPFCSAINHVQFDYVDYSIEKWTASDKMSFTANSMAECVVRCIAKSNREKFFCSGVLYNESDGICNLAELVYFPNKLRVAWSSSTRSETHSAWKAIDNESDDKGKYFASTTKKDIYPWYAIDLIYEHEVHRIEIVERDIDIYASKTNDIEVRVGNERPFEANTNGDKKYTFNNVCGVLKVLGKVENHQ